MKSLTESQWQKFQSDGFLRLGKVVDLEQIEHLRQRIDEIMLGTADINYSRLLMQLDSESGSYEDLGQQGLGHKGAGLNYRKIQGLEFDALFLEYLRQPVFEDICRRTYGEDTPVNIFRAMFMNKPANKGTFLPWHQDRWSYLNRDPKITLWTALDPATIENGCVQVIPGSHHRLLNPEHVSGFLTPELTKEHCPKSKVIHLELEVGEVVLLHNWLLHASDRNASSQSRRAFSVCYMDGATEVIGEGMNEVYHTAFEAAVMVS